MMYSLFDGRRHREMWRLAIRLCQSEAITDISKHATTDSSQDRQRIRCSPDHRSSRSRSRSRMNRSMDHIRHHTAPAELGCIDPQQRRTLPHFVPLRTLIQNQHIIITRAPVKRHTMTSMRHLIP